MDDRHNVVAGNGNRATVSQCRVDQERETRR